MALPNVSLSTGVVSWTAPTLGTDGKPLSGGDAVTGYIAGLRSLTATGSVVGVYPIQSPSVAATQLSDALSSIAANLKADQYAASVQAQSANGPSAWATEFQFQGTLPVPQAPAGVSVA